MNFTGKIVFEDSTQHNGQERKPSDTSKLQLVYPIKYTELPIGLSQTISWFTQHYETGTIGYDTFLHGFLDRWPRK